MPATILPQPVENNGSKLSNGHKNGHQHKSDAISVKTCTNGNKVTLTFPDG